MIQSIKTCSQESSHGSEMFFVERASSVKNALVNPPPPHLETIAITTANTYAKLETTAPAWHIFLCLQSLHMYISEDFAQKHALINVFNA
jgi:hypothetical protein